MSDEIFQFISLLAAAVLTGNELGTWAVVHPAVQRLPLREQVHAEQEVTRRYGYFMPALMIVTIVAAFVTAARLGSDSDGFSLTLAAGGCYAVMLAITLAGNVPVNVATLKFQEDDGEARWRALRRRWDRLHTVRVALDVAGLVLLILAVLR